MQLETISGWGGFPRRLSRVATPRDEGGLRALTSAGGGMIARGSGRAYGDSAIGSAVTLDMRRMNRMISFDPETGVLVAEAGVTLAEIIETFLPRGWFPYVTPGTKYVTIGGAIAADVHGKNHHKEGSFGAFVDWVELLGEGNEIVRASRGENSTVFSWTLGGMGLTGVILRAALRLRPVRTGWIRQKMSVARNLDAALESLSGHQDATYSVAWIDCLARHDELGRSLVMLGEHAELAELPSGESGRPLTPPERRKKRVPFHMPTATLNRHTVKLFNALYWRNGNRRAGTQLVDWDSYFYPLDAILGWNRIYGKRGFVQFQCALPLETSRDGLTALLQATSSAGLGSFLAVLKKFGEGNGGLSFPMPGYTLALDFPANRRSLALLERLDAITIEHGGRFYLAKDARLAAHSLHQADPRTLEFRAVRRAAGLDQIYSSAQSERLLL